METKRLGAANASQRLNKYLAAAGVCSRREADRLIADGRVTVNGRRAETGQRIMPEDLILIDGKPVFPENLPGTDATLRPSAFPKRVLLAFYKPRGVVCTTGTKDRAPNVVEYIGYPDRIYPVGRLDKESEGLLLLTNRGELVNQINRARYEHEKEYEVRCKRPVTDRFLNTLAKGVRIRVPVAGKPGAVREVETRPCTVARLDASSFRIVLTQGLNRQIRRMCAALGSEVTVLKRIRVMNICLSGLKPGEWREVKGKELKELEDAVRKSKSKTRGL